MPVFICCADLHVRSNAPENRTDDYFQTVSLKFNQIIDIANKYDASLLCAGDVFDHVKVGHRVVNMMIISLRRLKKTFFLVPGQHDLPNHKINLLSRSPLMTLLLQPNVIMLNDSPETVNGWDVYGCPWGGTIPKIKGDKSKSILVIHHSITPEEPPFFLKNADSAKDFMDSVDFKIIVSGDYHVPFIRKSNEALVINCGPMVRQKLNESDLQPVVFKIDTSTNKFQKIPLRIKPANEVFTSPKIIEIDGKFKDELSDLINSLKEQKSTASYEEFVNIIVSEIKPGRHTVEKIKELMNNARTGIKKTTKNS